MDAKAIIESCTIPAGLKLVTVTPAHLAELEAKLRFADRIEIRDLCPGRTTAEVLKTSVETSLWAVALLDSAGRVICVGGLGLSPHGVGVPWLLGTDLIAKNRWGFLELSRQLVDLMLIQTGSLFNCCDRRNIAARRWLSWLGFDFLPDPIGKKPGLALYFHKQFGA